MISPDSNGLYHPSRDQDVIDLITYANANKLQVRVRGAAQSADGAVYTDGYNPTAGAGSKNINMELDQLRSVVFNMPAMQVTVGAGCNLGFDPYDPSGTSAQNNSNNLFAQLNSIGWSIPNVTNAIHQTIGGFISTGSSAGTMQHSFDECIVSITLIDGTGKVQIFNQSNNPQDPFYAAGLSLGLLGVITSVTLQCVSAFNIIGQEKVTKDVDTDFDFYGPGSATQDSFQTYLSTTEFSRTLWWPMSTLKRVIAWKAKTMTASDYNSATGIPPNFKPVPYKPLFHEILGSKRPMEIVASTGFNMISNWPNWLYDVLGHSAAQNTPQDTAFITAFEKLAPNLYPFMVDMFFPLNSDTRPPQEFWDLWLGSLPMDAFEYSNNLFDISFAEMYVPISQTQQVVETMNKYFTSAGYSATGFYAFEILAAKSSQFWMSPSFNQDSMRFNIMYFNRGANIPAQQFFNQFWDVLKQNNIDFRPNWGKYLPLTSSSTPPSYIQSQFPHWNAFMGLRSTYDPNNIFLNSYWKNQLGI